MDVDISLSYQNQTNRKMKTFETAVKRVQIQGYNLNQALNICKRINTHIAYCMDNKQDYDETLEFIKQDFNFNIFILEPIVLDLMIADPKIEEYYNQFI